ncbi:hypothetical protein Cob_v001817 [Colletotrichum orbiculare MAFF 240422]|uniref:Uncharacterized protein n=1 Tax=Colletotrichum orbiculare (strain 104-T / ATCC 96160 / CBS 514.97 / LARS 414 / MAFF 240422) TaxID=1213857 RepID=A0A484G5K4_COLOR|nr:hypothetical protein Cob_v001817 [Colletotrichum orbiculare MAFF 240422]
MHRSWFSYAITRPYPFRWFTPVVIIGGIILAVPLSLANLSANGFYLKSVYTSDPNGTEASTNELWFRRPPFNWQSDVQAKCQPYLLSVGDSFFTSNQGFRYTVKAIGDSAENSRSTVGYKNNTFHNCVPTRIAFKLRKVDTAAPSWWLSWSDSSTMEATVKCGIITDDGLIDVTLAIVDASHGDRDYGYVVNDDYRTRASIWWGTRLLNAYWNGVMSAASQMGDSEGYVIRAGLTFTTKPSEEDILTDAFFDLYWWMSNDDTLHCAKILYSLLALDLGNCRLPNLLLNDDGLRYAIIAPDDSNRVRGGLLNGSSVQPVGPDRYNEIPSPGGNGTDEDRSELKESYDMFRPRTGPLGCSNATIVTQYLCSVPQQKGWGVLIFSILVADLVFLQAAWKILAWVSDGIVARQVPDAMSCQNHGTQSEAYELIDKAKTPHRAAVTSPEEG